MKYFFFFIVITPMAYALGIKQDFVQVGGTKIEYLWSSPSKAEKKGVIFYLHPHYNQGARYFVEKRLIEESVNKGYTAVAVSTPGYGESEGSRDFSGPESQKAVRAILNIFRKNNLKLILYGVGNGALTASMISSQENDLKGMILISGFYDLEYSFAEFEERSSHDPEVAVLHQRIKTEIGNQVERFYVRSALLHVDKIKSSALILNGKKDTQTFPEQSQELSHLLRANGVSAKTVIFKDEGHEIPQGLINPEVFSFLEGL